MSAVNRGKQFEEVIYDCFLAVQGVSIDRIHDQTTGFKGSKNICDFIAYKYPNEFYFECKAVHGNLLPFSNITEYQWKGMIKKSKIPGVIAGVICWWVDKDVTRFIPIEFLQLLKEAENKSVRYDVECGTIIYGTKKRVFFDYDMQDFLERVKEWDKY